MEDFAVGIIISLKTIMPLMALVLAGLLVHMRRTQHRTIGYLVCFSVFYVYLLFVLEYTIFPLRLFDSMYTEFMLETGVTWRRGIQLVPFRGMSLEYLRSIQGFGNVLLAVPFGFGLPFITRTTLRSMTWMGLAFPISIETAQFLLGVAYGYSVRIVDINDVLLNFVGVLLGLGLFRALAWLYKKAAVMNEPSEGIWKHIHTSLTQ